MSHNSDASDTVAKPSDSVAPPCIAGSEGSSTVPGAGNVLQGASAVSDIVGLAQQQASAYAAFDPALHATNPDGSPKLKKGGGFQLKRGRKPQDPNAPTAPRVSTIQSATPGDEVRISNDQAALMFAGMTVGVCTMLLGDEWQVANPAEKKALVDSTRAYLDATGGADMTPGTALVLTWMGGYGFPRLVLPETQSRLARFGQWVKGLLQRRKP